MKNENSKRCIILGAASLEEAAFAAACVTEGDMVLCADGGLRHARTFGLTPHAHIGDFDSGGETPPVAGLDTVKLPRDKDCTDTQACIQYGLSHGLREFVLLGCTGGPRLDHFLGNLALLEYCADRGAVGRLIDDEHEFFLHTGGLLTLTRAQDYRYLSLIPLDALVTGVTLEGLRFPLRDAELKRGATLGLSNEPTGVPVHIRLSGRALVVLSARKR